VFVWFRESRRWRQAVEGRYREYQLIRLTILAVNGVLRARGTQRAVVDMLTPGIPEKITRIGCGAVVGLVVGFALAVGIVSYYANSAHCLAR
jgi:hypothetical protein